MPWYELKKSQLPKNPGWMATGPDGLTVQWDFDGVNDYVTISDWYGRDLVYLTPDEQGISIRHRTSRHLTSGLSIHADRKPRIGKWRKVKE